MFGVRIEKGPSDWQIIQQIDGVASITLSGTWHTKSSYTKPCVYACLKREDTGEPVVWWQPCETLDHTWKTTLLLPAGGLYRIETCLTLNGEGWSEWGIRGDSRFHIGVGDLFVIAGQSNSAGYGKDYIYDPPELGVHLLKNNGSWDLAAHPLQDSTDCTSEQVNVDYANTSHSLYLAFAKYLKRELGYPIGLLQTAKGGSPLSAWDPESGVLYKNLLRVIRFAGGKVKGIIWYQGCSDTTPELCESYRQRFLLFRESLMGELGADKLPTFVFQLNRCIANRTEYSDECWGVVREQQRQLSQYDDIYVLPTNDCSLSDAFAHITAKSNMALGERLAKSVLCHLYDKRYFCDAPNLTRAIKSRENEVTLSFEHVYDKLDAFEAAPDRLCFTAIDDQGSLIIQQYDSPKPYQIRLIFDRTIGEQCYIHGAHEMDLPRLLPFDYATHLPMLSFYGVKVEE